MLSGRRPSAFGSHATSPDEAERPGRWEPHIEGRDLQPGTGHQGEVKLVSIRNAGWVGREAPARAVHYRPFEIIIGEGQSAAGCGFGRKLAIGRMGIGASISRYLLLAAGATV